MSPGCACAFLLLPSATFCRFSSCRSQRHLTPSSSGPSSQDPAPSSEARPTLEGRLQEQGGANVRRSQENVHTASTPAVTSAKSRTAPHHPRGGGVGRMRCTHQANVTHP